MNSPELKELWGFVVWKIYTYSEMKPIGRFCHLDYLEWRDDDFVLEWIWTYYPEGNNEWFQYKWIVFFKEIKGNKFVCTKVEEWL